MDATDLGTELADARARTDELFSLVAPDAIYDRPIAERHRIVFYLGHVEAFDWNLLRGYRPELASFHPEFDRLFAFGIDPPPGQLPADQPHDWPSIPDVEHYNRRVRAAFDAAFHELPEEVRHVAIEHRLMHAETLAYILHNLPFEKKLAPRGSAPYAGPDQALRPRMVEFGAGKVQLGLPAGQGFGWDNEFEAHCADVPAFSIGKYKVTNGEYLQFVRDGAAPPFFWMERDGQWRYRGMFQDVALPLDAPVYVTHDEAESYAQWRGMRLPAEAEFQRAASAGAVSSNSDFRYWDPIAVNADEAPHDGAPQQMVGNGWEWTSTIFAPFPGFRPMPFYANYSEPFFDGAHYVLKGGSPRTAACMLRPSFRNWFRPAYPYLYSTFRLVAS
ncbi:MAG TPA: SUMF1/EgtB/PvdO family nonheme iron enzyme [Bryobacteraceae bacterium]|jgi:formylglycine-generating enzyme required for sulfatase activity|nr:SUMF1/EgtB/PvdO family nonheme iron enzyme [Bryobacteraceae bacterium]